jgi:hypothetical protein
MELEDLKERITDNTVNYSRTELEQIFQLRTKRTVSQINNKMLIDVLLMILTTAVLVTATFIIGLRSRYVVSGQIIGFSILIFIHYRIKHVLLNRTVNSKYGIREATKKLIHLLNIYINAYKIILPNFFALLVVKHFYDLSQNWEIVISNWPLILTAFVFGFLAAYMSSKIIYGKEIERLKGVVTAMD